MATAIHHLIVLFQSAISRHEHVQISFHSFVCFVWLNEIVAKSSHFEQCKSNHYKWSKCTKKYQNDKYIYLPPSPTNINSI